MYCIVVHVFSIFQSSIIIENESCLYNRFVSYCLLIIIIIIIVVIVVVIVIIIIIIIPSIYGFKHESFNIDDD